MIRETERDTYAEMWEHDAYAAHSPGVEALPMFLEMAGIPTDRCMPGCVLDAGCGSGATMLALQRRGFLVRGVDLVDVRVPEARSFAFDEGCLWSMDLGQTVHYVYCADVLEHIPPEFTMLVVARLLAAATTGVFIQVSLVPDRFGVMVGRPLHLSVFPFTWWRDHLRELGRVVECRDLAFSAVFYVEPK
jgi:SAM-dependent methyltransferase